MLAETVCGVDERLCKAKKTIGSSDNNSPGRPYCWNKHRLIC
jgi:hypothetical protein